jgi:hypothetical protein
MANYADYVKPVAGGIDEQITEAERQQQERLRDPNSGQFVADPASTPEVDWEQRYLELERLNSRQAQTLGDYRSTIDQFITNPTPAPSPEVVEPPPPITVDALYDDPNAVINSAVENHPAIQEARQMKAQMERDHLALEATAFQNKHPDFQQIGATPEFQNWVEDDDTRKNLYSRSDRYDFSAADALFRLYKAEKGMADVTTQQNIQQAELVSSSGEMVQAPPTYSRYEYVNKLTRAKQGDLECEQWIKHHAANYRLALGAGNVRD